MSAFLTNDDQPLLAAVASLLPQRDGTLVVHDTRSGQSFALSALDGQIVRSCNGRTSVARMVEAFGPRAQEVLLHLVAMGLVDKDRSTVAGDVTVTEQASSGGVGPFTEMPLGAGDVQMGTAPIVTPPAISSPSLLRTASRPELPPVPGPPRAAPGRTPEGHRITLAQFDLPPAEPRIALGWEPLPSTMNPVPVSVEDAEPPTRRERPPPIAPVQGTPRPAPFTAAATPRPFPAAAERRPLDGRTVASLVLLFAVVAAGGLYHRWTVARLEAMIARAGKPNAGGPRAQTYVGQLVLKESVDAEVAVAAKVNKVLATKGQSVNKGTVLVELEEGALHTELTEAVNRAREATRQRAKLAQRVPTHATQADLDEATRRAETAGAQVHSLQETLEQYRVRAPLDGIVTDVMARAGQPAAAHSVAVRIGDPAQLAVELTVPPAVAADLAAAQRAEVTSAAVPNKVLLGAVLEANAQSGLVRVQLKAREGALMPGQSVSVAFAGPAGE